MWEISPPKADDFGDCGGGGEDHQICAKKGKCKSARDLGGLQVADDAVGDDEEDVVVPWGVLVLAGAPAALLSNL